MDILDKIRQLPDAKTKIMAHNTKDKEFPRFEYGGRWYECFEKDGKIEIVRVEETRTPSRYVTTSCVLMEHIVNAVSDCEHEDKQSLFHYNKHVGYHCSDCNETRYESII